MKTQLVSNRSKVHTKYITKSGRQVPGATTVTGILDKPALIYWAWNLGCQGIDYKKHRDELAGVGSLAHDLISCHIKDIECDTSAYSAREIDLAENAFLKYLEWEKRHKLEPILVETPLVCEADENDPDEDGAFGGTPDFFGLVDGVPTLLDFKTSKAIYTEHYFQLAAYKHLLEKMGHEVDRVQILRIGRTEDERFEEGPVHTDLTLQWRIFSACLCIYSAKKKIERRAK